MKNGFDLWFEMMLDESDKIQEFDYYNVIGEHTFNFNYTKNDMLKIFKSFSTSIKKQIKNTIVKIDIANGDINHFIEYIFKGYAKEQERRILENE